MQLSDSVTHKNGRQRKPAVPQGDMRDRDMVLNTTPDMEVEGEALHRGYDAEDNGHPRLRPGIRGELGNVSLLLFLYVLQGIPLGLAGSIPLILQSKNVSYKDQAFFSFVFWPFSLKLLWAPLVDALYLSRFGRRKSWLVPTQYLLGLFMLYLSVTVDTLLKSDEGRGPDVVTLTAVFFMLAFLAATQDIAVDGWALTMLSRENVGYASTCNSVGQTAGYFLGNVLFLALESADFCNKYLRAEPKETGIVTLSDFLFFWGVVFLVSTTLVAVMKKENARGQHGRKKVREETQSVMETYKLLLSIIKMPAVVTFCSLLLTAKIGFSAADAVTGLKLVEAGVPKEQLALLAVPMVPLQILLPLIISKYTAGPRPLDVFYKAFPFRLLIGLGYAVLVWWTPSLKQEGGFPLYYYTIVLFSYALHQVTLFTLSIHLCCLYYTIVLHQVTLFTLSIHLCCLYYTIVLHQVTLFTLSIHLCCLYYTIVLHQVTLFTLSIHLCCLYYTIVLHQVTLFTLSIHLCCLYYTILLHQVSLFTLSIHLCCLYYTIVLHQVTLFTLSIHLCCLYYTIVLHQVTLFTLSIHLCCLYYTIVLHQVTLFTLSIHLCCLYYTIVLLSLLHYSTVVSTTL
ncbi:acetyl-coenzyme A transporter 1 isoform X2 [Oncorhynchus mykiss]|uniref:acetyl-coenzyme A transporter 1 isoform X2 n=1 Tax=Oncorhynchus mykiss TaxID=8022 RepID=UPI0018780E63|nr:acetyl-coenzyme A transporter 1 isoform X2 [Oncorhynchus mykiss]